MIYTQDITIDANTFKGNALRQRIVVSKGLVYRIEVEFPSGCAGLAHIVIADGNYQVWPSNASATFHASNHTISFEDLYLKEIEPYFFDIWGYNLDEEYCHTIQVRVGLITKKLFMARFLPTMTYDYFLQLLEEVKIDQERLRQKTLVKPFSWID